MTRAEAKDEAAKCPNVTQYLYSDGQGNTQKAISDIQGFVAKGVNAIVVFPDAGKAMLPALRSAYKAGVVTVPYRVNPGGKAGKDYDYFVVTDFKQAGVLWANWLVKALKGKGNVVNLGGPAANSQSLDEYDGMMSVLKDHPGIKFIGQTPYNVTNWDPAETQKVVTRPPGQVPADRRDHHRLRRRPGQLVPRLPAGEPQDPADRDRGRQPPRLRLQEGEGLRQGVPALHRLVAELDVPSGRPGRRGQGHRRRRPQEHDGPAAGLRGLAQRQAEPGQVRHLTAR